MSLTPQQAARAEQAFRQSDEGGKGYLHSKEFFYACQALGFNYTFVEVFEMYKRYDDDNNLGMDLDEFKGFYAEKLRDPDSHVDPTKVTNVYRNDGRNQGNFIPQSTLQPGVYQQSKTTISQTHGAPIVHKTSGGQTTYTTIQGQPTTTTYTTSGGQTVTQTTTQGQTITTQGQKQTVTTQGQPVQTQQQTTTYTTGGQQVVYQTQPTTTTVGGQQVVYQTQPGQQVVYQSGPVRTVGGTYVSNAPGTIVTQGGVRTYTTGGQVIRHGGVVHQPGVVVHNIGNEMARYDTEGKGWITREQLRVACRDLAVKCDTDEELDEIWNEIDLNGTGRISSYEFGEFYDYVKGFRDIVRSSRR